MDDLISRREAIDVIDKIFPADPMRNDYTQGITCGAALATEYIKQLPSTQSEIIRCKDCKFNVSRNHKCLQPDSFFLVTEDDFYCGYAERRTDERQT